MVLAFTVATLLVVHVLPHTTTLLGSRIPHATRSFDTTHAADTTHTTSSPDILATINTDTGEFAPGYRDFSRYTDTHLCWIASESKAATVNNRLSERASFDALQLQPARDSQAVEFSPVADACLTQFFTRHSMREFERPALHELLRVAVRAADSSLARAIVAQQLARAKNARDRNLERVNDIRELLSLDADPSTKGLSIGIRSLPADVIYSQLENLAVATELSAAIDTMTTVTPREQMEVHFYWLAYAQRIRDTLDVQIEANHILMLARRLPPEQLGNRNDLSTGTGAGAEMDAAYRALIALRYRYGGGSSRSVKSLTEVAEQARTDYGHLVPTYVLDLADPVPFFHKPLDTILYELAPQEVRQQLDSIRAPKLMAAYWFPVLGNDTIQPMSGKLSLWIYLPARNTHDNRIEEGFGGWDMAATAIRQWLGKFGSVLTVTVVATTQGGSFWEGIVPPIREAEEARWYVQEYLHLPVTVAVQQQQFILLPRPDERRFADCPLWQEINCNDWFGHTFPKLWQRFPIDLRGEAGIVLTDRTGHVLYAMPYDEIEGAGGHPFADAALTVTRLLETQQ